MMQTPDSTASIRHTFYWLIGTIAVAMMIARIVGAESVVEPSRYAPPTEKAFGAERLDKPKRTWPTTRPEPSPFYGSNDRSRWATIHAMVDRNTFVVGNRENFHSNNKDEYRDEGIIFQNEYQSLDKVMNPATGEFYSSKPPLLTVLLAGEYWCLQKLFGWKIERDRWPVVCTILITVNVLPFAFFLIVFMRIVERFGQTDFGKLLVFVVAALATFLMTFSNTLNNHTPAAYCVLFALAPQMLPGSNRRLAFAVSGFFAGFAAALELPAAAFTVALVLPLLYSRVDRTLAYFTPAMLLPIVALVACNYWAMGRWEPAYSEFGGPWYNYEGSHWAKLKEVKAGTWHAGIDFATEPKWLYAFHLLFGHHGWFSLTPIWLLALVGIGQYARSSRADIARILQRRVPTDEPIFTPQVVGTMTAVISAAVIGFYIHKTNNYGGNTSGPRWLFWLIPLWLIALIPAADAIASRRWGKRIALVLLGLSVISVYYPVWNPWRPPWIQQLCERTGWYSYDVPPKQ